MAVFNEIVRINDTSALLLPVGTTGQQPAGVDGLVRYNSDTKSYEGYSDSAWRAIGGQYTTSISLSGATSVFTPNASSVCYELFGIITVGSNRQTVKVLAGVDNGVWDYTIYSVNSINLSYTLAINASTGELTITATGNFKFKSTEI